ncbi:MAG: biopolymer transporter ExbB [Nitrospinae bacterium]|nr:biopolymer transporter ExbB [Nitrospinota bacterium]
MTRRQKLVRGYLILILASASVLMMSGQVGAAAVAGAEAIFSPGVWQLFTKGGYTMIPIGLCSVITVAVVIERLISLRREKILPNELVSTLENHLIRADFEESTRLCERFEVPFARVVRAGLSRRHLGIGEMERAMVGTGQHEATVLSRNLRTLGVVANLAPMLGLFGTVVGMIRAFAVISQFGTGNPSLVAEGISEALLTTAAGLLVGIPSLAAYHFFRSRGDRFLFEIETIAFELLHIIAVQTGQDGTPRRASIRPAERTTPGGNSEGGNSEGGNSEAGEPKFGEPEARNSEAGDPKFGEEE